MNLTIQIPNAPVIIILISFLFFFFLINIHPIAGRHVAWGPQNSSDTGSSQWIRTIRVQHCWNILIFFFVENCVNFW